MLQAIVSGLVLGAIYALIAQGYYVTYITTNTMNFGQGDFLMLGALLALTLIVSGIPFLPALIITVLALAVMGVLLERVAIRPLRHFFSIGWILSTVAVSIIVRNAAMLIWGRNVLAFPSPFGEQVLRFGPVGILPHEIFVGAVSLAAMAMLFFFLKRSVLGKALMAVAYNRDAASLMGINPVMMAALAYLISAALAGLGGIMIGPITFTAAFMGAGLGLKAFAAAIIGGLENPYGILIGGLILWVVEQVFALWNSATKDLAGFVLILIVLIISPTGLFGKRLREKF